jgi:uncharacterized membrane protein (UPF0127 family)
MAADSTPDVERLTVDGAPVAPVEVARSFAERSRDLLGRDGVEGAMWIEPASSVHTVGMRFPIDVAFLDRRGHVLRTVTMAPNRLTRVVLRSRVVVEAEVGSFAAWGLGPGNQVALLGEADPEGGV